MQNVELFNKLKGGLIVSCQALPDEPLFGSHIMAKMAKAALSGGAVGIRANTKQDILAIRAEVDLPIIGLVKKNYSDSDVFITPTLKEINELLESDVDVIALDATLRERPNGEDLEELLDYIKKNGKLIMADISIFQEGIKAIEMGVDCLSTTLSGYTPYSNQQTGPDFELIKNLASVSKIPVFAEGKIQYPEEAKKMVELGAHAVVVGSAITRPQLITERFNQAVHSRGLFKA